MGRRLRATIAAGVVLGEVIKCVRRGRFIGFYLRFYEHGRRRQIASKQPTYAEARKLLVQIEARIARGEVGIPVHQTKLTVAELTERFLVEYSRPRIKDLAAYRARVRAVLSAALSSLGSMPAHALRATDVTRLRDRLAATRGAGTVRNVLSTLSLIFSWAVRQGLVSGNPTRGIEKPASPSALDFWSKDEVRTLLGAARTDVQSNVDAKLLYLRVLFTLHTGVRKGELLGLRWRDLDIASKRLTIARSYRGTPKSGKARHLRLPDAVISELQDWAKCCPKTDSGLVFPVKQRRRTWGMETRSSALLGLPGLLRAAGVRVLPNPWHALRHTFASHYIMNGGNLLALQRILGHSDVKTTLIYAHLAPDFLGDEMNRVDF